MNFDLVAGTRTCTKCGETKVATVEFFHRHDGAPDGLNTCCKVCVRAKNQAWKEQNREKARASSKRWKREHPERARVLGRASQARCLERRRAAQWVWRAANLELVRSYTRRRRATKLGASGSHTTENIQIQYSDQTARCFYCGCSIEGGYHVEHCVPLSRGGSDGMENIVLSCGPCNMRKNSKTTVEFDGEGVWGVFVPCVL